MARRKARPADAADAVRTAVDRTVQATVGQAQMTRGRAQDLVDELSTATGRVREVLDDARPATGDDIRSVRGDLDSLERRVAKLERGRKSAAKRGSAKGAKGSKKKKAKATR